jgi:hypothetical protein
LHRRARVVSCTLNGMSQHFIRLKVSATAVKEAVCCVRRAERSGEQ